MPRKSPAKSGYDALFLNFAKTVNGLLPTPFTSDERSKIKNSVNFTDCKAIFEWGYQDTSFTTVSNSKPARHGQQTISQKQIGDLINKFLKNENAIGLGLIFEAPYIEKAHKIKLLSSALENLKTIDTLANMAKLLLLADAYLTVDLENSTQKLITTFAKFAESSPNIIALFSNYTKDKKELLTRLSRTPALAFFFYRDCSERSQIEAFIASAQTVYQQTNNSVSIEETILTMLDSEKIMFDERSLLLEFAINTPYLFSKDKFLTNALPTLIMTTGRAELAEKLINQYGLFKERTLAPTLSTLGKLLEGKNAEDQEIIESLAIDLCIQHVDMFQQLDSSRLTVCLASFKKDAKDTHKFLNLLHDTKSPDVITIAKLGQVSGTKNNTYKIMHALQTLEECGINFADKLIAFLNKEIERFMEQSDTRGTVKKGLNLFGGKHTTKEQKFREIFTQLTSVKGRESLLNALLILDLKGGIDASDKDVVAAALISSLFDDTTSAAQGNTLVKQLQHAFAQARGFGPSSSIDNFKVFLMAPAKAIVNEIEDTQAHTMS